MKFEKVKHYVVFMSPGTLVSETSQIEMEYPNDIQFVLLKLGDIVERHGSKPYGFYFKSVLETYDSDTGEMKKEKVNESGIYYINGKIFSYEDIKNRKDPNDDILIRNMEYNKIEYIIETCNSWKHTAKFNMGIDRNIFIGY